LKKLGRAAGLGGAYFSFFLLHCFREISSTENEEGKRKSEKCCCRSSKLRIAGITHTVSEGIE
jgi:hypothetical protein